MPFAARRASSDIEDDFVLLKNRCGLITGAASGMGAAAALLFASHGARVMCAEGVSERVDGAPDEILERPLAARHLVLDLCELELVERGVGDCVRSQLDRAGSRGKLLQLLSSDHCAGVDLAGCHINTCAQSAIAEQIDRLERVVVGVVEGDGDGMLGKPALTAQPGGYLTNRYRRASAVENRLDV